MDNFKSAFLLKMAMFSEEESKWWNKQTGAKFKINKQNYNQDFLKEN